MVTGNNRLDDAFSDVVPMRRGVSRLQDALRLQGELQRLGQEMERFLSRAPERHEEWTHDDRATLHRLTAENQRIVDELQRVARFTPLEEFLRSHQQCPGFSVTPGDGSAFYPSTNSVYIACHHEHEGETHAFIARREDAGLLVP